MSCFYKWILKCTGGSVGNCMDLSVEKTVHWLLCALGQGGESWAIVGADLEKWKEMWLNWPAKHAAKFLANWTGMLIDLCQSTCFCSCQCSAIMKRMKQTVLFGFLLSIFSVFSEWLITLCLQEGFVQVNQWVLKERISIVDTAHPRGVASHPNHLHPRQLLYCMCIISL